MSERRLEFEVRVRDARARLGRLSTPRGEVATPAFMPVGTAGTVKGVTPGELRACGAQIVLSNTYHLFLRPGHDVVRELGGLHRFMNWDGPILTDSGGFQVFSMADLARLDDQGVEFRSHVDGSVQLLTPERSMEVQAALGSDIAMALDECPPLPAERDAIERAVRRTTAWAARCKESWSGDGALFGIVQGGSHRDLREQSARELIQLDFPGYAIGGVSVGEPSGALREAVELTAGLLPEQRPRYLMGVGRPSDIVEAVAAGVDMFDCVMPTRNARNGTLFVPGGKINIKRNEFKTDRRPIQDDCPCEACGQYSRGYLRHLFLSNEILASRLNTIHNLTFYLELMRRIRESIEQGRFAELRAGLASSDRGATA